LTSHSKAKRKRAEDGLEQGAEEDASVCTKDGRRNRRLGKCITRIFIICTLHRGATVLYILMKILS
jgi:hypothetical protein